MCEDVFNNWQPKEAHLANLLKFAAHPPLAPPPLNYIESVPNPWGFLFELQNHINIHFDF
jgi:hypothetical protein